MKVKIVFGSDIRRWHMPEDNQYEELLHFVRNTFNFPDAGNFFLQFEDDEGDRMTISSAGDLSDALVIARQEGRKSLKIYLVPVSIHEAQSEAMSQFSGARSVSSLDRFEVISNPQSHADSSFSASIEVPELNETDDVGVEVEFEEDAPEEPAVEETGPRPWKEELADFLANEEVVAALPEYVKAIMGALRAQTEPDLEAALRRASREEFAVIENHPLMVHYVFTHIDEIANQGYCLLPVLLAFDDDHIANLIPQLAETGEQLFAGVDDAELDVTPIFGMLFPEWMEQMNRNNPDGATVDLSHIFGCGDAFQAAAAMMSGAEQKEDEIVHEGIICDMCNADPIVGPRFKCAVCPNFDLCATCEATNTHNRDHPLLKLSRPRRGLNRREMHGLREMFQRGRCGGWKQWHCRRGSKNSEEAENFHGHHGHHGHRHGHRHHHHGHHGHHSRVATDPGHRVRASFVDDVNIPDRSYYRPGVVLEKVWRMQNTGATEWGENVSIVFVKGCRSMTLEERYPVPNAQPGDFVDVKAMIRTPDRPNHYCTYYRLEKDGNKFGPRIWVDVFVTEDESQLGDSNISREEAKHFHRQEKLQKKQERLAEKQAAVQAKIDALTAEIEAAQQPESEGTLSCMCGSAMVKVHHANAYGRAARINCDSCGHLARDDEEIYHCPNEFSPLHPEGFDICDGCARDQLQVAQQAAEIAEVQEEIPEVFEVEMPPLEPEEPATEVVVEEPATEVNPTAPPAVEPEVGQESGFPFQDAFDALIQMGFGPEEQIRYLLVANEGNVENVLNQLLN